MRSIAILLLLVSMISTSCESQDDIQINVTFQDPDTITYLALGDSYTIGEGVSGNKRWPNQLSERLQDDQVLVKQTKIIAKTGWTTTELLTALSEQTVGSYDLVSLLIGVNNQYRNLPFEVYMEEWDILIEQAIVYAGKKEGVFVVSIPDYGVTPFGSNNSEQIAKELDEYNQYAKDQCALLGIPFIDITEISRMLGNGEGALAEDQLHPSGQQYAAWVEEMYPIVLQLIKSK